MNEWMRIVKRNRSRALVDYFSARCKGNRSRATTPEICVLVVAGIGNKGLSRDTF